MHLPQERPLFAESCNHYKTHKKVTNSKKRKVESQTHTKTRTKLAPVRAYFMRSKAHNPVLMPATQLVNCPVVTATDGVFV